MTKKQRITIGSILKISIDNDYYVYAQILGKAGYAFFDFKTKVALKDFSVLLNKPVLFITSVYDDVITNSHWKMVASIEIREDLKIQPMQFIQDELNPNSFEIYDPNSGEITPASKEQVKGLERASVWEASHIEDRIRDYYNGNPCIWLEDDIELFKD